MWRLETDHESGSRLMGATIACADSERTLTFAEVIELWQRNESFATFWLDALKGLSFSAYCWETPALTKATLRAAFECRFIESPALLGSRADIEPFATHFAPDTAAVAFPSLGNDALMVAPCPAANTDCAHLASFVRTAETPLGVALWRCVGETVAGKLNAQPLWLSTAGLGVSWLHVRLDTRPKYYRHRPYADPDYLWRRTDRRGDHS